MMRIEPHLARYQSVFIRYMLATTEIDREEALFEVGQISQAMIGSHAAVDQAIELHGRTQRQLAERWDGIGANAVERLARERLLMGDATPLMLALMLPHELAERAHHEQRWRRDNGKLAAIFEQTDDLIVILDSEGRIDDVNPAFLRATGWSPLQALAGGQPVWQTVRSNDGTQVCRGEQPRADGSRYTAEWSVSPVLDRDGRLLSHVCIGRDVTHQVLIADSLRENDKLRAVATLAAGIAHDFNNLLGSINGLAELCELDAPAGSRLARNLGRIRQAGDKAAALVRQMLDFSRQTPNNTQRLRLGELLAHAEGLLRAAMPPQVALTARIANDGPVWIDLVQMEQVLLNVTRNAAQAMGEAGGSVQIVMDRAEPARAAAAAPHGHLRLRITDNGPGIAADVLPKIFDPFFTTKPVGEGTGLGLAAVHDIVSSHGGVIEVSSPPGAGATFSIFLPLAGTGAQVGADAADRTADSANLAAAWGPLPPAKTATEDPRP
jgi:signal transduction histidine kinase